VCSLAAGSRRLVLLQILCVVLGRYFRSVSSHFCNLKFGILRLIKANYTATVNTVCYVGLGWYSESWIRIWSISDYDDPGLRLRKHFISERWNEPIPD